MHDFASQFVHGNRGIERRKPPEFLDIARLGRAMFHNRIENAQCSSEFRTMVCRCASNMRLARTRQQSCEHMSAYVLLNRALGPRPSQSRRPFPRDRAD